LKKFSTNFEIDGAEIPVEVILERRANFRVAVVKKGLAIRLPTHASSFEIQNKIDWSKKWLTEIFQKKPNLKERFVKKIYENGQILTVGDRQFTLQIIYETRETHTAALKNGVILLKLNPADSPAHLQKSIKTLLSRVVGQEFLPKITERVHELNRQFFNKNIRSVSLKYNSSNWGSCSSADNLNFSTRLLFAPPEVIDYVIVHELAHLFEMNHSDRFWNIVEKVMPDYQKKEKWLKTHGTKCDF
jgi:predicted metal-dependent hydrolase